MKPPDSLDLNLVQLSGNLDDLEIFQASDHGFVWTSRENVDPTVIDNDGSASLGVKTPTESPGFSATATLDLRKKYVFRAYAVIEGNQFYSAPEEYETGTGSVNTLNFKQDGLEMTLTGKLDGTEKGTIAVEHGFVWTEEDRNPRIEMGDQSQDLGNRRNDSVFFHVIKPQGNTIIRFAAFAVFKTTETQDIRYGETKSFILKTWERVENFSGQARDRTVAFSIDGKGYIGTGAYQENLSPGNRNITNLRDFWRYDPEGNSWEQMADFGPIEPDEQEDSIDFVRREAVGFAIGNKGYIGTGLNSRSMPQSRFWEYNPSGNTWREVAPYGGGVVTKAVAFAIEGKGYVGTGQAGNIDDPDVKSEFWEFDPSIGQQGEWRRVEDYGGGPVYDAVAFSIGKKGYVGTGTDPAKNIQSQFWEFDPNSGARGKWRQLEEFGGGGADRATAFSIGEKGYVGAPWNGLLSNEFWEFNPNVGDLDEAGKPKGEWRKLANYGGSPVFRATSFSIGNKGYMGLGKEGLVGNYRSDFWVYEP